MAEQTVATRTERTKVKAGSKEFSFIPNNQGEINSYSLEALKKLGFSMKGFNDNGELSLKCFGYDNEGMKYRFELVDMKSKSKDVYPVWASNGLKEEIETLTSYKESKNGNPYYKVPESMVAFYEVTNEATGEIGIIVGRRGEVDDATIL